MARKHFVYKLKVAESKLDFDEPVSRSLAGPDIVVVSGHNHQMVIHVKPWKPEAPESKDFIDVKPPEAPESKDYFSWLAILTPKRIWNEDVGDALETIHAMERAGCSRLKIKVKVVSTYFWVFIAVVRELVAALTGRKSPHK